MKRFFKTIIITLIIMQVMTITAFAEGTFSNWNDIENDMYQHFVNRDANFSFLYTGTKEEFQQNIRQAIKDAYSKDDYLERSWVELRPQGKVTTQGIETTINATYLTTKEQEDYVNNELIKETAKITNSGMSDFEKVKAINDYIINRFEYDYTLQSKSAYSALTTSVAICQGYSMTAYKMLNYAGIENRIVVGTARNISHSWNCVKIDGEWYNLDITNNDSIRKDKYFLVGDNFLLDNNYVWDRKSYPSASKGYYE